jgi:hypothetical protein
VFVQTAEKRIYVEAALPASRKNVTGSLTMDDPYLTLPDDWLATYEIAVLNPVTPIPPAESAYAYQYLLPKDVSFVRESFPNPADTGIPEYYAIFDNNTLLLGPTPDDNYNVELHYLAYPTSIVTASTTWLGDNFDYVLLYGTLREAYLYMLGEADITAEYEKKYQESLGLLKKTTEGLNRRDDYRNGQGK